MYDFIVVDTCENYDLRRALLNVFKERNWTIAEPVARTEVRYVDFNFRKKHVHHFTTNDATHETIQETLVTGRNMWGDTILIDSKTNMELIFKYLLDKDVEATIAYEQKTAKHTRKVSFDL